MINFEKQDAYTLDMPHFGLTKGIRTPEFIENKVKVKTGLLHSAVQDSQNFTSSYIEKLIGFLQLGMVEFPNFVSPEEEVR